MNTYAVHLYTQVRVKVSGVKANNMMQACEDVENALNLHDLLDNRRLNVSIYRLDNGARVESAEWAEGEPDTFMVCPVTETGESVEEDAVAFGPDGVPLVDGKTTTEWKAANADWATKFMAELLASVETLTGIAEQYGPQTLADLMYLQNAILTGGEIDFHPDSSHVLDIVRGLPSRGRWVLYINGAAV